MSISCPHCGEAHSESLKFCPRTGKLVSPERLYPLGSVLEGKYRLEQSLGVGGMSVVFKGRHVLLNKIVAIKLLLPEFAKNQEMCARLLREARAASATGHRNIVSVSDLGYTEDGSLFVVMEYVSGRTMKQLITEEAPLSVVRALDLVDQLLCALEVVHRKGIVHRDLKPANLLISIDDQGQETVNVLDFGISKVTGDEHQLSSLTTVGKVMGTPRYMSPEQALGDGDVDHRADIYSCGVLLYELLTGRTQFVASTYHEMVAQLLNGTVEPPSTFRPQLPRALDPVVLRALARAREQRFPDAASLRRALRGIVSDLPVDVTQKGVASPARVARQPVVGGGTMAALGMPALDTVSFCGVDREQLVEPADPPPAEAVSQPESARGEDMAQRSSTDPSEFMVSEQAQEPLELAASPRSVPEPTPVSVAGTGTVYRPSTGDRRGWMRGVLVLVLVTAGAAVVWHFRDDLWGAGSARPTTPDEPSVYLLVETEPAGAEVYVDGVLAVTRPIQLPRTERTFTIRVQARRYQPEEVEVTGARTRTIRVKLRRR